GQTAITAQTTHTYTVPGTYIASAYYALTSSSEDGFSSDPTVLASATITVTAPVITSLTLSPSALTMMVGDERTFALTDQDGKAITGAAWTVDLPTVATLSADDPPIITAVNPGTATITAFIGSVQTQATVNVVPYSSGHIFPPGT